MVKNGENIWMFNDRGELLITRLSPKGLQEISRTKLIDPTTEQLRRKDGGAGPTPPMPISTSLPATTRSWFARTSRQSKLPQVVSEKPNFC